MTHDNSPPRLRWLAPLAGLALLAALGVTRPVAAASASSTTALGFRGAARDGRFAGTLPHRRPAPAWTFATDGPVRSSPLLHAGSIVFGSGDGNLYAVDATSGRERWRFATGGAVDGSPVVAEGAVVVASRDGNLYAVDATSGQQRWKTALGAELPFRWGWDFFLSTPAVVGDRLYVGSGSGEVLALEAKSGKVLWRHATGGRVRSSPTVVDGTVYVGSFDGHLYALDAKSGAQRWRFATQGATIDSVAAGFDRQSIQGSPLVTADQVVVGGRDGHFYGVDRQSGKERWNHDHGMPWVVGSPALAGMRAVVGSSDGDFVTAVDLPTGKEVWRSRVGSNVLSSPAIAGDVMVAGDMAGNVLALDVASGRELWRLPTGDCVVSTPLVDQGTIYVGSDDGKLYALRGDLAAPPVKQAWRAVYMDPYVGFASVPDPAALRDALVAESYRHLGRNGVVDFLRSRIADRAPSVVVFAQDNVPTTILEEKDGQPSLVRSYLDAGGKIVWLASNPFAVTFDPQSEKFDYAPDYVAPARKHLQVTLDTNAYGSQKVQATPLGREWGLPAGWWTDEEGIPEQEGIQKLAVTASGRAPAWVKSFGGPPGTGFVQLWTNRHRMPDPKVVQAVAEHGLP